MMVQLTVRSLLSGSWVYTIIVSYPKSKKGKSITSPLLQLAWDLGHTNGGVQAHVDDNLLVLKGLGHHPSILSFFPCFFFCFCFTSTMRNGTLSCPPDVGCDGLLPLFDHCLGSSPYKVGGCVVSNLLSLNELLTLCRHIGGIFSRRMFPQCGRPHRLLMGPYLFKIWIGMSACGCFHRRKFCIRHRQISFIIYMFLCLHGSMVVCHSVRDVNGFDLS